MTVVQVGGDGLGAGIMPLRCQLDAQRYEWAPNNLYVNDPGGQGGDLSSYLTWNTRQEVLVALASAADRAKRANEAEVIGNHEEAKRLWKIVLGSSFPS